MWTTGTSTVVDGPLAGREYRVRSCRQSGPPVIVLHEVLGPSPATLSLADWLVDRPEAFSVYVPALFGDFGERSSLGLARSKLCLRREFVLFRRGLTSPIVSWLKQLVSEVSDEHDGAPVGVIGMCLTGGFAMALLTHPSVPVAVASQPSLPLAPRLPTPWGHVQLWPDSFEDDLGLSPDDVPGAGDGHLVVLRHDEDWICPRARVEAAAGDPRAPDADRTTDLLDVETSSRGHLVTVAGAGHPVLSGEGGGDADQVAAMDAARVAVRRWLADALVPRHD